MARDGFGFVHNDPHVWNLLVRGDHELNEIKAEKLPQVAAPLRFATDEEIRQVIGAGPGGYVAAIRAASRR